MKLLDNINSTFGEDLKQTLTRGSQLKIAAAYFSIYAYAALKKELEKIEALQFIFTSPTFVAEAVTDKVQKEKREFIIPKRDRESSLYGTEFEIHLKNQLTQKAIAKECAAWIKRKVTFKSNKSNAPMQALACLQKSTTTIAYMPIQDFTPVGLGFEKGDAISNIVNRFDRQSDTDVYLRLFNQMWQDKSNVEDVTQEIIQHIESVYQENAPERIYFLVLYHLFQDFLEDMTEDVMPNDRTGYQNTLIWKKLFNFQRDAAVGVINKLETYNGCILADSVGLGKTFTALAVIKYYELRNKSVLVLCPKKLSDNWTNYNTNSVTNEFVQDRFNYDVLYHTDLSRTGGRTLNIDLTKVNWGNYDLVVIDESHNFRNRDKYKNKQTRYDQLMHKIIQQGVKTKVLMLSATPVNNRFTDLKNQLALAYEGNASLLEDKLNIDRDIETIFRRAQTSFNIWTKLAPHERTTQAILNLLDLDFFKLLDSVTIARSRKHIQTFYDTRDIGSFPKRKQPISVRCPLSTQTHISLNQIYQKLSSIQMAVYAPVSYIFPSALKKYEDKFDTQVGNNQKLRQMDREKSLQALMTINLLKRLESSIDAFRITLTVLKKNIETILNQIDQFEAKQIDDAIQINPSHIYNGDENEDDNAQFDTEDLIGKKLKIHLADIDRVIWQADLIHDLQIIVSLLENIEEIDAEKDAKLQDLKQRILDKIQNPINPSNRKIIVFTAFADTARYLYKHIAPFLLEKHHIHSALITGTEKQSTVKTQIGSRKPYETQGLLTLFSPQSKQKAIVFPKEKREIDLLIATDCISEGQNLQDCDYLINFDIHWNPVRIIQRFGRIDRIGSKNEVIQLVNYWPDISLDEYINLRERVENRMIIVDMTSTGDDNVLSAQNNDIAYRREQLQRLQNEVLDLEEAKTGVSITDLGLNDFRMDLLNYMAQYPELEKSPKGLHTVVPAKPELGLEAGVIFVLKARHVVHNAQINRLYPYYLMYINQQGKVIYDHTQAKYLLDSIRKACRGQDRPIPEVYEPFNQRTEDGSNMQQYSKLLDIVVNTIQEIKAEKDIDSLFSGLSTTALVEDVSGLNDFELISFIVIEEVI